VSRSTVVKELAVASDRQKREHLRQFEARQVLNRGQKARLAKDQWVWSGAAVLAVTVSSLALFAYSSVGPGAPGKAPSASLSENREWSGVVEMDTVSLGITLDGVNAPQATANFVSLVNDGFYETSSCHRLTTEALFVVQCGDPFGLGFGGPGYTFGPVENDPADGTYPAGTIAMARSANDGDSMGSQFFIVYEDTILPSDLAGGYTVFGAVTSGLDDFIERLVAPGTIDGSTDGQPAADTTITSITIR
jgi:peptidyl-prolyl cis-trans isomerase B (cyclophilin B)